MKIFYITAILFFCVSVNAQLHIGAKSGVSIPNLKGNNEQSKGYKSRLELYRGIFINFPLTNSLSLQPEVNFSPQGGQRKGLQEVPSDAIGGVGLPGDINLYAKFKNVTILNYLEIPILAKLVLGQKFKYYICFGPHIAFLVEAKTKTSGSSPLYLDKEGAMPLMQNGIPSPSLDFNSTTDIKESIKKVNGGVQEGLGIEYSLGPGNFFLEGRAIIGVINIQTHPEADGKNKTGSLAAALGYLIRIR